MEDLIEDSRIASEREENALRERMKRLKEKEDNMKLELSEGRREVERMNKAEAGARSRVEEIEEALRESQAALENARAEIEGLRADLGVGTKSAVKYLLIMVPEYGRVAKRFEAARTADHRK